MSCSPKHIVKKGDFSDLPIQQFRNVQRRNISTGRTALGPFPDESILSGVDEVLCFLGISSENLYEFLNGWGSSTILSGRNYLSSNSLSSLSEVNLGNAAHSSEYLKCTNLLPSPKNLSRPCTSESARQEIISSDCDYESADSKSSWCLLGNKSKFSSNKAIGTSVCNTPSESSIKKCDSGFNRNENAPFSKKSRGGGFKLKFLTKSSEESEKCDTCSQIKSMVTSSCGETSDHSYRSTTWRIKCRPRKKSCPLRKSPSSNKTGSFYDELSKKNNCLEKKSSSDSVTVIKAPKPMKKNSCRQNDGIGPKIVNTKWAVARVNYFDDKSRTFEIMDLKKKLPKGLVPEKTMVFLAVLRSGVACCYDCVEEKI